MTVFDLRNIYGAKAKERVLWCVKYLPFLSLNVDFESNVFSINLFPIPFVKKQNKTKQNKTKQKGLPVRGTLK